MAFRFPSWSKVLLGIVFVKAILSLAVKPGPFVISYSGISYFLLLLTATAFAFRNALQNTLRSRPFWTLLAIGYGLWALHQFLNIYYELGLHTEVPDSSLSDPILFLHVAPFLAGLRCFRITPFRIARHGPESKVCCPYPSFWYRCTGSLSSSLDSCPPALRCPAPVWASTLSI